MQERLADSGSSRCLRADEGEHVTVCVETIRSDKKAEFDHVFRRARVVGATHSGSTREVADAIAEEPHRERCRCPGRRRRDGSLDDGLVALVGRAR